MKFVVKDPRKRNKAEIFYEFPLHSDKAKVKSKVLHCVEKIIDPRDIAEEKKIC